MAPNAAPTSARTWYHNGAMAVDLEDHLMKTYQDFPAVLSSKYEAAFSEATMH